MQQLSINKFIRIRPLYTFRTHTHGPTAKRGAARAVQCKSSEGCYAISTNANALEAGQVQLHRHTSVLIDVLRCDLEWSIPSHSIWDDRQLLSVIEMYSRHTSILWNSVQGIYAPQSFRLAFFEHISTHHEGNYVFGSIRSSGLSKSTDRGFSFTDAIHQLSTESAIMYVFSISTFSDGLAMVCVNLQLSFRN